MPLGSMMALRGSDGLLFASQIFPVCDLNSGLPLDTHMSFA